MFLMQEIQDDFFVVIQIDENGLAFFFGAASKGIHAVIMANPF